MYYCSDLSLGCTLLTCPRAMTLIPSGNVTCAGLAQAQLHPSDRTEDNFSMSDAAPAVTSWSERAACRLTLRLDLEGQRACAAVGRVTCYLTSPPLIRPSVRPSVRPSSSCVPSLARPSVPTETCIWSRNMVRLWVKNLGPQDTVRFMDSRLAWGFDYKRLFELEVCK